MSETAASESAASAAPVAAQAAPATAAPATADTTVAASTAGAATASTATSATQAAPETSADPQPVVWEKTGDAGLDMALGFVGARGFGPQHPAVQAAIRGDFSLLKAELAGMGAKATGYEAYVTLAEKAYENDKARAETQEAMSVQAVHSAVGGDAAWAEIHQWAKANADPHERAEINAMMDAGPRQAKAAALYLKTLYENANGSVQAPASAVKPGASGHRSSTAGGPITDAREYSRLVLELEKKVGKANIQDSPEYHQLKQRRLAGRRVAR